MADSKRHVPFCFSAPQEFDGKFWCFFREEKVDFKLPRDLDQAKRLGLLLLKYKDAHYYTVLFSIAVTYIM